jgi:hypothetical protein
MYRSAHAPPVLVATARRQSGIVSLAQCHRAGLSDKSVRGLVRRGEWRRVVRGVFEIPSMSPEKGEFDRRRRRAAWLALLTYGADAVAVGTCALALHGVAGLPATIQPEAALPRASNRRNRDAIRIRQFDHGMEIVMLGGCRVVTLRWALAQAIPELPRHHALAVLDDVLHRKLLPPAELRRAHDLARGRRGIASRHDLWEIADSRAESPLESFARLECIEEGIAPDTLQLPFRDLRGSVVARGDLAWSRPDGSWLVAEMDGTEVHSTPTAVFADRRRQNMLTDSGAVRLLRFTGQDVGRIATTVRRSLSR